MTHALRYLAADTTASRNAITAALRPGAIVRVSDAPIGVPIEADVAEGFRRFVRVLSVERAGGRLVSLTVDWYGVPRTVAGHHVGIVGAMVAA